MSPTEVIAAHFPPVANDGRGNWICRCGDNVVRTADGWVKHVVSELEAHDYDIVKLPKADSAKADSSGTETFSTWALESPVVAWRDGEVSIDAHVGGMDVAQARELGLALLAAAASSEKRTHIATEEAK